jgi:membrane-associated protein
MDYRRFFIFNVLGAVAWSFSVVLAGYFFGTLPVIKQNLNVLIYLVILVTAATIIVIIAGLVSAYRNRPPKCD